MSVDELKPRANSRFWASMVCACDGLTFAFRHERNFRFHCLAAGAALFMCWWLRLETLRVLWVALAITLVMTAELFNTSMEAAIDLVTAELHPLARAAKDLAAGATLVTSGFALIVGLVLFLPPLLERISC